jgi:branched-chain amino acid transport system ATP-binding protein
MHISVRLLLSVQHLDVHYGDFQALWDITFEVGEGRIVAVLGSNGAGKSTLLKAICGLLHPSKGLIDFFGKRIDEMPPEEIVRRGISIAPEGRRIFPFMSVMENLKMGAYAARRRRSFDVEKKLKEVFALFPSLEKRQKQLAGTLSGGEQEMLAIGRALMSVPKLLLLDEPSLGIAPLLVGRIFETIGRIRDTGVGIVIVEQNVMRTLKISDDVVVLRTGKVVITGSAKKLVEDPRLLEAYIGR